MKNALYVLFPTLLSLGLFLTACTTSTTPTAFDGLKKSMVAKPTQQTTPVTPIATSSRKMSLRTVESKSLGATFYVPSGWYVSSEVTREPLAPEGQKVPCINPSFYKNPADCTDGAETFLLGFNSSGKASSWPNFDMSISGPTSGLGGGCPSNEWDFDDRNLTVNGHSYTVKIAHNKTTGIYSDCYQWEAFRESGSQSKWKQFGVMFRANSEEELSLFMNILESAQFN